MFGKLFGQMYDSSLVEDWRALVTFQQLVILCDADGIVDMTPEAIIRRTNLPADVIRGGLALLEQPDPRSRTPDEEGRRIVRLDDHRDWGWRIVNHAHYRDLASREDKRAKDRLRIAEKRRKANESGGVAECRNLSAMSPMQDARCKMQDAEERPRKRGTRLPDCWEPSPDLRAWAVKERPDLDPDRTLAAFRDYWIAQPGQRGVKLDWDATYRNWVRKESAPKGISKPSKTPAQSQAVEEAAVESQAVHDLRMARAACKVRGIGYTGATPISELNRLISEHDIAEIKRGAE